MKKFFQNLIHKITGIKISEHRAKDLGRLFGILILFLAYYIGFFSGHPDNDPFNVGNIYEAIHPLKVHDLIGVVLFTAGVAWITGIIEMIIGEIKIAAFFKSHRQRFSAWGACTFGHWCTITFMFFVDSSFEPVFLCHSFIVFCLPEFLLSASNAY